MVGELLNHNKPFSGKSAGVVFNNNALESTLDLIGTGSQSIEAEQEPLAPDNSTQWANGMPNSTEFIKSRINPSGKWRAPFKAAGGTRAGRGPRRAGMVQLGHDGANYGRSPSTRDVTRNGLQTLDRGGPAMSGIKKRHIGIVEKRAWIGTGNWDPTGF
jgi:hypothetical protein